MDLVMDGVGVTMGVTGVGSVIIWCIGVDWSLDLPPYNIDGVSLPFLGCIFLRCWIVVVYYVFYIACV